MRKVKEVLKVIPMFVSLPFEISKGAKRRTVMKIKKTIYSVFV